MFLLKVNSVNNVNYGVLALSTNLRISGFWDILKLTRYFENINMFRKVWDI